MKTLLLLFISAIMLITPVKAANFLFSEGLQTFYRADPSINKLVIDSTFSEEFTEVIKKDVKSYYDISEVEIKSIKSSFRETGVLPIVNMRDEDFSWCECGGYFWARRIIAYSSEVSHSIQPIIVVPEGNRGTLLEEIGHSLGLDEASPRNSFILKKTKKGKSKWVHNELNILGADQIMSYGSEPMKYGLPPNPSDNLDLNIQAGKELNYFSVFSTDLSQFNGADLLVRSNQDIDAVVDFNFGKTKDGYMSAIGYLEEGVVDINLPKTRANYRFFIVPKMGGEEVPNPEDISGLNKPLFIGRAKVNRLGQIKFGKNLKKYGFGLLFESSSSYNSLKVQTNNSKLVIGPDILVRSKK
ncbi:hypothetical protein [Cognatishimia sp.]|uniref:hypothetical protein n=1 Tax=Cognatishimia sp. TaxID=2211648 RepID=UPI0035166719|nr:hypothetical protein [Cognatishimia sp.]